MPRFVPDSWKPVDDSSEGYRTLDPESIVLHVSFRPDDSSKMGCPCGCGDWPTGDKTVFCMGHDARLRGKLIRAHLTDTPVRYVLGSDVMDPAPAAQVAEAYFWGSYLDGAVLRRDGKNREVARRAMNAGDRLLKLAKWSITGQVIAIYQAKKPGMHSVEWVDKAGNVKQTTVRADESPLADIAQEQVSA